MELSVPFSMTNTTGIKSYNAIIRLVLVCLCTLDDDTGHLYVSTATSI